ncbi:hypothetical protein [Amycolatopsis orientalis]|uniref:hypothetical protein n=1 Tax=Amycolatopsis orientalis TaxID=31958 RepID=UPI00131A2F40|nr:hypothetical protein [Amycolatopsis orientalis]
MGLVVGFGWVVGLGLVVGFGWVAGLGLVVGLGSVAGFVLVAWFGSAVGLVLVAGFGAVVELCAGDGVAFELAAEAEGVDGVGAESAGGFRLEPVAGPAIGVAARFGVGLCAAFVLGADSGAGCVPGVERGPAGGFGSTAGFEPRSAVGLGLCWVPWFGWAEGCGAAGVGCVAEPGVAGLRPVLGSGVAAWFGLPVVRWGLTGDVWTSLETEGVGARLGPSRVVFGVGLGVESMPLTLVDVGGGTALDCWAAAGLGEFESVLLGLWLVFWVRTGSGEVVAFGPGEALLPLGDVLLVSEAGLGLGVFSSPG